MKDRFELNGYAYETKAEWEEAKREEESVQYIRTKVDLKNPSALLKMYTGLAEKRSFITPVGLEFMNELRRELLRSGSVKPEELPGVPVSLPRKKKGKGAAKFAEESESKSKMMADYYHGKLNNLRIVTGALVVVIIAMFLITVFGPNSALEDAEIQIQDKYASWEQQLTERENAVRLKEQELGITY